MEEALWMRYKEESKMSDEEFIEEYNEEINGAATDLIYGNPGGGVFAGVSWNYSPYGAGFYFDGSQFNNFYDLNYWYERLCEHNERINKIAEQRIKAGYYDEDNDYDYPPDPSDYYYSLKDAIKDGYIEEIGL